jgi:L-amino acid N-acyltransferase YncA
MTACIELMTPADWLDVHAIYEEGIATGLGTFETVAPSWEEWNAARALLFSCSLRQPARLAGSSQVP